MLQKLKSLTQKLKQEIHVYQLVMKDRRTPKFAKFLLWFAIGYVLMPIDLIPDFIPFLGLLDDLVIVPILFIAAIKLIPKEVMEDCRKKVN